MKSVILGLTFSQSVLAAELTTDEKFRPHAAHSFFMLSGWNIIRSFVYFSSKSTIKLQSKSQSNIKYNGQEMDGPFAPVSVRY